jgi:hypothetical protein
MIGILLSKTKNDIIYTFNNILFFIIYLTLVSVKGFYLKFINYYVFLLLSNTSTNNGFYVVINYL